MEENMGNKAEPKQSAINLTLAIPWILTLVTVAVGIWQFTAQQEQATQTPFPPSS
jgi:hypothetical protein